MKKYWYICIIGIVLMLISQGCSEGIRESIPKDSPKIEAEKQLAIGWKLEKKITESQFLKAFENENNIRLQKLKKGQPIYGPQQYTLEQYYAYTNRTRIRTLCNEVIQRGLIEEQAINNYYEKNKETDYRIPDTIKFKITELGSNGEDSLESNIVEIKPENIRYYAKSKPEILKAVQVLKPQETVQIVLDSGKNYKIECQKREMNGYIDRSELYDNIQEKLAQQYLENILNEIIKIKR